jgi:hypothetical protein
MQGYTGFSHLRNIIKVKENSSSFLIDEDGAKLFEKDDLQEIEVFGEEGETPKNKLELFENIANGVTPLRLLLKNNNYRLYDIKNKKYLSREKSSIEFEKFEAGNFLTACKDLDSKYNSLNYELYNSDFNKIEFDKDVVEIKINKKASTSTEMLFYANFVDGTSAILEIKNGKDKPVEKIAFKKHISGELGISKGDICFKLEFKDKSACLIDNKTLTQTLPGFYSDIIIGNVGKQDERIISVFNDSTSRIEQYTAFRDGRFEAIDLALAGGFQALTEEFMKSIITHKILDFEEIKRICESFRKESIYPRYRTEFLIDVISFNPELTEDQIKEIHKILDCPKVAGVVPDWSLYFKNKCDKPLSLLKHIDNPDILSAKIFNIWR